MTEFVGEANPLIGTWKLLSLQFEFADTNERRDAYDQPSGFLIITADGRMMTVLADNARLPSDGLGSLFDRMMAYSGRCRLLGDDCFIVAVDVAWHPSWIGTEQTRYFKIDHGILSIISPPQQHPKFPGQTIRGVIVWQKE
jgi:hypothetical protein